MSETADARAAAATKDAWNGILDPDERIVWQGRPGAGLIFRVRHLAMAAFGVLFAGFAVFWMTRAAAAGGSFWMFGLIHFAAGVAMAVGPTLGSAWRRRHTWYTLTDRRAFVATDMPVLGRKLKSYPIDGDTVLSYDGAEPGTIHFAHEYRRGNKNRRYRVDVGFERIADAREVYAMVRRVQRGEA